MTHAVTHRVAHRASPACWLPRPAQSQADQAQGTTPVPVVRSVSVCMQAATRGVARVSGAVAMCCCRRQKPATTAASALISDGSRSASARAGAGAGAGVGAGAGAGAGAGGNSSAATVHLHNVYDEHSAHPHRVRAVHRHGGKAAEVLSYSESGCHPASGLPHTDVVVVNIPGNPGAPSFYDSFSKRLFQLSGQSVGVVTIGHAGHSRHAAAHEHKLYNLNDQSMWCSARLGLAVRMPYA